MEPTNQSAADQRKVETDAEQSTVDVSLGGLESTIGTPSDPPVSVTVAFETHGQGDERTIRVGQPSRRFGDYELQSEIARGGMGVVFRARQLKLNRLVALKMILTGQLAGEEAVRRFQTEAEAAAKLDHPNIVPIYEIGEAEGLHFFSMGYVDGESLAQRLRQGPLDNQAAAVLLLELACAVQYAHEQGVIHRDLKPGNVLLRKIAATTSATGDSIRGGSKLATNSSHKQDTSVDLTPLAAQPMLTDFGLAKIMQADSELTSTGQIMGTPAYMPPEQAGGRLSQIGPASDVYSLGAILYCVLTGRPPFQAAGMMETLQQVLHHEPVPPRQLNPDVDRDLEVLCLKCLEKQIPNRFASAAELASELQRWLVGSPIKSRRATVLERTGKWIRRRPAVAALMVMTVILVSMLGALTVGLYFNDQLKAEKREVEAQREKQAELARRNETLANLASAMSRFSSAVKSLRDNEPDGLGRHLRRPRKRSNLPETIWADSLVLECMSAVDVRQVAVIENGERLAVSFAFCPDSRLLAVPEHKGTPVCRVHWIDPSTGEKVGAYEITTLAQNVGRLFADTLRGNLNTRFQDGFNSVAFSPDGRWFAAGLRLGRVMIWDRTAPDAAPQTFDCFDNSGVDRIEFSGNSSKLFAATTKIGFPIKTWEVSDDSWQPSKTWSQVNSKFAINPANEQFFYRSPGGSLAAFDWGSNRDRTNFPAYRTSFCSVSPDGQFVAIGHGNRFSIVATETGLVRQSFTVADGTVQFDEVAPVWIPGRGVMALSGSDDQVRFVEIASGRLLTTISSGGRPYAAIATSPDGRWFAVGGKVVTYLYEIRDANVTSVPLQTTHPIDHIDLSGDGNRLAFSSTVTEGEQIVRTEFGLISLDQQNTSTIWVDRVRDSWDDVIGQGDFRRVFNIMHETLGPLELNEITNDDVGSFAGWHERYLQALRNDSNVDLHTMVMRDFPERTVRMTLKQLLGLHYADEPHTFTHLYEICYERVVRERVLYSELKSYVSNLSRGIFKTNIPVMGWLNSPSSREAGQISLSESGRLLALNSGALGVRWLGSKNQWIWPQSYGSTATSPQIFNMSQWSFPEASGGPNQMDDPRAIAGTTARWDVSDSQRTATITLPVKHESSIGHFLAARIRIVADRLDPPVLQVGTNISLRRLIRHGISDDYQWHVIGCLPANLAIEELTLQIAADPVQVQTLMVDQVALIPTNPSRDSQHYQVMADGPQGFTPDGQTFMSVVGDHQLMLWNVEDGVLVGIFDNKVMKFLTGKERITCIAPGNERTAVGTESGHVFVLDTATCQLIQQSRIHQGDITSIATNDDETRRPKRLWADRSGDITSLAISDDETLLVVGSIDGQVSLVRTDDLHVEANWGLHSNRVVSVSFAASDKQFWSAGRDGSVLRYERQDDQWRQTLRLPDTQIPIRAMQCDRTGNRLAILRDGQSAVQVWNIPPSSGLKPSRRPPG